MPGVVGPEERRLPIVFVLPLLDVPLMAGMSGGRTPDEEVLVAGPVCSFWLGSGPSQAGKGRFFSV